MNRPYLLATLVAAAEVNPVTFNSWRNRNGLFPRTSGAKGYKRYSIADVCVTYCVNGFTKTGCTAQFAVDASMALLPRFEALVAGESADPFEAPLAIVMRLDPEISEDGEDSVDVEYVSRNAPIYRVISGRLGWGMAQIVDMLDVLDSVIENLKALGPETSSEPEETDRLVARILANALDRSEGEE